MNGPSLSNGPSPLGDPGPAGDPDRFEVMGMKYYTDGALGSRGALLLATVVMPGRDQVQIAGAPLSGPVDRPAPEAASRSGGGR